MLKRGDVVVLRPVEDLPGDLYLEMEIKTRGMIGVVENVGNAGATINLGGTNFWAYQEECVKIGHDKTLL